MFSGNKQKLLILDIVPKSIFSLILDIVPKSIFSRRVEITPSTEYTIKMPFLCINNTPPVYLNNDNFDIFTKLM